MSEIDVFVSYSAEDRERVGPLVDALKAAGLRVWWDTRIAPGTRYDEEIQNALDDARCILVAWSRTSVGSEWVVAEADEGLGRGILIPVAIDEVRPPLAFRRRQTIPVLDGAGIASAVAAVQALLERGPIELPARRRRPGFRSRTLLATAATALVLGLLGGAWLSRPWHAGAQSTAGDGPHLRVPIEFDGWQEWKDLLGPPAGMAISPDGSAVAYVARDGPGAPVLRVRHLDRAGTTELPGTEGASAPFFSPDGRDLGFFVRGVMKRVALAGGEPSVVVRSDETEAWGASWGSDGDIVYSVGRGPLLTVSATGGTLRTITRLDAARGEGSHRMPDHVPGTDLLLFSAYSGSGSAHRSHVLDLDSGERHELVEGYAPRWVHPGHVLFSREESGVRGALWIAPFDADRGLLTAEPELVESAVGGRGGAAWVAGRTGPLVVLPSQGPMDAELVLREVDGDPRVLLSGRIAFERPEFSPDGASLAFVAYDELSRPEIRILDVASGGSHRHARDAFWPLWGPGEDRLTYMAIGTGLVHRSTEPGAEAELIVAHDRHIVPTQWVGNGRSLLYNAINPMTDSDVHLLTRGRGSEHLHSGVSMAKLAPGDRRVAFCTWPSGVYVARFPDFGAVTEVSATGCVPKWSDGGRRLYFQGFDRLWAVDVEPGSSVRVGEREPVAELGLPGRGQYDVDDRGRLVFARHRYADPKPAMLLVNWRRGTAED